MKKFLIVFMLALMTVVSIGCNTSKPNQNPAPPNEEKDRQDIIVSIEDFGHKLQLVSLQAPPENIRQSIQDHYSGLITPVLLAQWQADPTKALGRTVSSPWPDRIEVLGLDKASSDSYAVKAQIILITSLEKVNGGIAARQPVDLVISRVGTQWLIDKVSLGTTIQEGSLT